MNRIILTGTNSTLPQDAAQQIGNGGWPWKYCRNCGGDGFTFEFWTNDPSERAHKETCAVCDGDGVFRKDRING
jgi:DnaJ-class molecular chaperone